jgi:hypothetical protein
MLLMAAPMMLGHRTHGTSTTVTDEPKDDEIAALRAEVNDLRTQLARQPNTEADARGAGSRTV